MAQDTFYDTSELSHDAQAAILRKAQSISERWWFDKLDCSESYARQRVEGVSFEDAMEHFVEGALLRVIHRRPVILLDEPHLEVVFRSMKNPVDYFLWIVIPLNRASEIVNGMSEL
jgi:hypothetical protein